ncbi:peptidase inhibitor, serine proteinase inhibitor family [Xylanibacter ruminicola 23]|uniref:Peptidase inhibitor, serine proteinase inhibitor family n=3 Tax=Xylanibacter ruminicola TaxID=839 RepID=D5EX65_XYLR2|nr:peptidase inhibitor, serine proteinase inhibitor family [Xylanibacter ruminicola 23]
MNMKKKFFLLSAIMLSGVILSSLLSCSSSEEIEQLEPKQVVNMLGESKPIQLTQEQSVFVNDNNQFTLNFLKAVNKAEQNGQSFIYSPLSITYVLGMVNDAATGQTEQELEQVMGFHQGGIKAVNDYCKKLIDGLPKVDDKVTLNIANALFVNKNRGTLQQQYQQDMKQYYDAQAENLDFKLPSTLKTINDWASDHTNGMIPTILDKIDEKVVTYLLNAIYFKADWASKFEAKNTEEEKFTATNGTIKLPLMHQNVLIQYLKNEDYSAIEIPYGNGLWKMTVMLPEEGKTTDDIIERIGQLGFLEGNGFCGTMGDTYMAHEVDLKLPRFETSSDTDKLTLKGGLVALLQQLGINLVFNQSLSEVPNMCEKENMYISMMRQKAKIKVNEEGSEAAAVTIGGANCTAFTPNPQPVEYPKAIFHANRPFVYTISEASSGVIVFVGKFSRE